MYLDKNLKNALLLSFSTCLDAGQRFLTELCPFIKLVFTSRSQDPSKSYFSVFFTSPLLMLWFFLTFVIYEWRKILSDECLMRSSWILLRPQIKPITVNMQKTFQNIRGKSDFCSINKWSRNPAWNPSHGFRVHIKMSWLKILNKYILKQWLRNKRKKRTIVVFFLKFVKS